MSGLNLHNKTTTITTNTTTDLGALHSFRYVTTNVSGKYIGAQIMSMSSSMSATISGLTKGVYIASYSMGRYASYAPGWSSASLSYSGISASATAKYGPSSNNLRYGVVWQITVSSGSGSVTVKQTASNPSSGGGLFCVSQIKQN